MADLSIEEMKKQKDEFQKKANEFKKRRDELHDKSKSMANERDQLSARIRQLRNQISEHKKRRDELNERVKHAKELRNEIIKKHLQVKKRIRELERDKSAVSGVDLNKLKQNLKKLENEHMTRPMSPQKEKKLIETIKEHHLKIREQEELLSKDPKLKKAFEEEKMLREKAEKQHEIVEKLAKKAQEEHQGMIELLRQLDNCMRRTSQIQEDIIMTKIEADKVHKEFISYVNKIRELEKKISALERKEERRRRIGDVSAIQKEASEIFERFKRGEKLSTEDIMILQKAGLL
jgi:uncharacterized coiled-coil DUF342 family protein